MRKILDFLTFADTRSDARPEERETDIQLRREERDAALLADKLPPAAADIESISEYRLASLLQFPHH